MKKGLLSTNLICNGQHEYEIINVEIFNENVPISVDNSHIASETAQAVENIEEDSDLLESNSSDEPSLDDESDELQLGAMHESQIIKECEGYKGIRNINTCTLSTSKYPESYKDLVFYNMNDIKSYKKNFKPFIRDEQVVRLVLQYKKKIYNNTEIPFKNMIFFNTYPIEGSNSILNSSFEANTNLVNGAKYIVDLGIQFMHVNLALSKNSKSQVHTIVDNAKSGVVSFIAPFYSGLSKLLIFSGVDNAFIGKGTELSYYNRLLMKEKQLRGIPVKIHKRYCTVKRMFNCKEEVEYFKNLSLYIKGNDQLQGIVKKSIGTHGTFKAYFNRPVTHGQVICMSLYKQEFLNDGCEEEIK